MFYEREGQCISSDLIPIKVLEHLDRKCYVYKVETNRIKIREGSRYQRDFDFVEKNRIQYRKLKDNKFFCNGTRWKL